MWHRKPNLKLERTQMSLTFGYKVHFSPEFYNNYES